MTIHVHKNFSRTSDRPRCCAIADRPTAGTAGTAAPVETHTIVLDGTPVTYTVRVSARARRVSVRISPAGGVELVLPRGVGRVRGEVLLREKARWVRRTLDRMSQPAPDRPHSPLGTGTIVPFAGEALTLHLALGALGARARAVREGATLTLTLPALDQETARAALDAWYRRQAPAIFAERLRMCNAFGFTYGRVSIKEQRSRWGSCSRAGNLNFNWRLLLAPLPVLDYVVMHELSHLREHNHGPRFWALVQSACPAFREHRRWLRLHGHELHF